MNYKQKYKDALERASKLRVQNPFDTVSQMMEHVFPELQESEDEKVKKAAIAFVEASDHFGYHLGISKENVLDWLEKQGEKLPVGFYYVNSEGKKFYSDTFKYGDVILHVEKQSEKKPFDHENQETQNGHKFNIGDIISNGKVEFRVDNIVKNAIGQDCYFLVNVDMEKNGIRYLIVTDSEGKHSNFGETTWLCEQVDKSFEKQGEQKSADDDMVEALRTEYEKGRADAITEMVDGWSVEDMSKVQRICKYLDEAKKYYADITEVRDCIDWLKSLKNRVLPQPKQEWNEEDEEQVSIITNIVKAHCGKLIDCRSNLSWLQSIKQRIGR